MTRMKVRAGFALLIALGGAALLGSCAQDVGSTTQGSGNGETTMVSAADLVGTWTSEETGNPTLAFDADGNVTGTDGCNGIGTTYGIDGETVRLESFISTMMACPGVDDWLRGVSEVHLGEGGDALTVLNAKGEQIGTLQRADDAQ